MKTTKFSYKVYFVDDDKKFAEFVTLASARDYAKYLSVDSNRKVRISCIGVVDYKNGVEIK